MAVVIPIVESFLTCLIVANAMFNTGVEANNPGLKIRITQTGLNYGAQVAIDELSGKVKGQALPDQSGEDHVSIGKVKYWLTNMRVTNFNKPGTRVTLNTGSGLTWSITGVSASVHGDWRYEYKKGWIRIKDHGSFDIDATASISISVAIGRDSTGRPTIHTTGCSSDISSLKIKFHGGASWLYNIFDHMIAKTIKGQLSKVLCSSAEKEINEDAAKALATMKVQAPIEKLAVLDYTLTAAPEFTASFIETFLKGEIFWKGDTKEAPFQPGPMADPAGPSKMVGIWLSNYVINSAGYVAQTHGLLKYNLTKKDVPGAGGDVLNATCTGFTPCIGKLVPEIAKRYPGAFVEVSMETTKAPSMNISPTEVTGSFEGDLVFSARQTNGQLSYLFTLSLVVNASVNVWIDGQLVKAKVVQLTPKAQVTKSDIGKVSDAAIKLLFGVVDVFATTKLNELGVKGIPLPQIDKVAFVNPQMTLLKDGVYFATDLKYTPSTTLYFNSHL